VLVLINLDNIVLYLLKSFYHNISNISTVANESCKIQTNLDEVSEKSLKSQGGG
jgi:hypothetical protein